MTINPITFSDIQTSDLLYYDADIAEDCFKFCLARNIDCLPMLNNPRKYYRRAQTSFTNEIITSKMCVEANDFIFNDGMLTKFKNNHLLFVFNGQVLTGVVHFSDYNKPEVGIYLFTLLDSYERSLRKLLAQSGYTNEDMLNYFIYKINRERKESRTKTEFENKKSDYERNKSKYDLLPPFEMFYLTDLIYFTNHMKLSKVHDGVKELRNAIMHAHTYVGKEDVNRNDYIYDFQSFKEFFSQVVILHQDYKKVNNRLAFLSNSH